MDVEDSVCTKELHDEAIQADEAARRFDKHSATAGLVYAVAADVYRQVERVSRRVDGERAEMLHIVEGFATVISSIAAITTDPKSRRFLDSYAKNLADEIANFRARSI